MNKQEFIAYIDKIPDHIEFTPMNVEVKGEMPNPDGSYRTMIKKIKFECTYTEMVHKLPYVKDNNPSMDNGDIEREASKLKDSIHELLSPTYGDNISNWGSSPIIALCWLLLECVKTRDSEGHVSFNPELYEVEYAIYDLVDYLKGKSQIENSFTKKYGFPLEVLDLSNFLPQRLKT